MVLQSMQMSSIDRITEKSGVKWTANDAQWQWKRNTLYKRANN